MKRLLTILLLSLSLAGRGQITGLTGIEGIRGIGYSEEVEQQYNPLADSLFNRMLVQYPDSVKSLISLTIDSLQYYKIWDSLDILYIFSVPDLESSLLNWKSRSFNATAHNEPVFKVDTGWVGDGIDGYLDTHFNPYSDECNYSLNSAILGIYIFTNNLVANAHESGVRNGTPRTEMYVSSGTSYRASLNQDASTSCNMGGNILGLMTSVRYSASNIDIYRNITRLIAGTTSSSLIPNGNLHLLAINYVIKYSTTNTINAFFCGAALNETQLIKMQQIIEYYMVNMNVSAL